MKPLSINQVKEKYPNQFVLLGNLVLNNPELNGSILSRLISGNVL